MKKIVIVAFGALLFSGAPSVFASVCAKIQVDEQAIEADIKKLKQDLASKNPKRETLDRAKLHKDIVALIKARKVCL